MKKIIVIASCFALTACSRPIDYNHKHYEAYGLLNSGSVKSDKMCYETSVGNVILGIVFIETIIVPVYLWGFSGMNPVGPKDANGNCGVDA